MNSSDFQKFIDYILLPHLVKHIHVHQNQFVYRSAMGCIGAITVLKDTVVYHNLQCYDVFYAIFDPSKACDTIHTS